MAELHRRESQTPTVTPAPPQAGVAQAPIQQKQSKPHVQLKRGLQMMGYDAQSSLLEPTPVQRDGGGAGGADQVHAAAAQGIAGGGGAMPHGDTIQAAFGGHDISGIQAHTGGAAQQANQAMGAEAYATGNHIAFGTTPDLHTAAHEAAHVVQQEHGVSLSGGVGQVGDAYEQHADQVADAVVSGQSAEPILNSMTGGQPAEGATQQKATQLKAIQLKPVQRTGPPGPPPGPAPAAAAPAAEARPSNTPEQISAMQTKLTAAKTGAAAATTLEAVRAVKTDAAAAKIAAQGLVSRDATNVEYATAVTDSEALVRACEAADTYLQKQTAFAAATTSTEAQAALDLARTAFDGAKTLLGAIASSGATWLATAATQVTTIKTAEEKIGAFELLAPGAVANRTEIGTAYTAADRAMTAVTTDMGAFSILNSKQAAAKTTALTALQNLASPIFPKITSGNPEGLTEQDGIAMPTILIALEAFGEQVGQYKEGAAKITSATSTRDLINDYGTAAPDRGEVIRTYIDAIEPHLAPGDAGVFAPWLTTHLRTTTSTKIEPKLTTFLRGALAPLPDGCEASLGTQEKVTEVENFLREADIEAAKGRITLAATTERARLAQIKECVTTNAAYAEILPLEELESEKGEEAKIDETQFKERFKSAGQIFKDKLKEISGGVKALGGWLWGLVTRKPEVSEQEKDALKLEMVQGASAFTSLLSTGGWAEALVEALFTLVPPSLRSTEQDREGRENQTAIAVGQGIQAGGNMFKAAGGSLIVGQITAWLPVDIAQGAISVGKFIQKKGEGYNALEAATFALMEYVNGPALEQIPIIGRFFAWSGAGQSVADTAGSALAVMELDISNRMLERDEQTLLDYKRKLDELEAKWTTQKFKPIPEFDTRYEATTERVLEVLEKRRVITVRRAATTG